MNLNQNTKYHKNTRNSECWVKRTQNPDASNVKLIQFRVGVKAQPSLHRVRGGVHPAQLSWCQANGATRPDFNLLSEFWSKIFLGFLNSISAFASFLCCWQPILALNTVSCYCDMIGRVCCCKIWMHIIQHWWCLHRCEVDVDLDGWTQISKLMSGCCSIYFLNLLAFVWVHITIYTKKIVINHLCFL